MWGRLQLWAAQILMVPSLIDQDLPVSTIIIAINSTPAISDPDLIRQPRKWGSSLNWSVEIAGYCKRSSLDWLNWQRNDVHVCECRYIPSQTQTAEKEMAKKIIKNRRYFWGRPQKAQVLTIRMASRWQLLPVRSWNGTWVVTSAFCYADPYNHRPCSGR